MGEGRTIIVYYSDTMVTTVGDVSGERRTASKLLGRWGVLLAIAEIPEVA